jgi:hypothetical protein
MREIKIIIICELEEVLVNNLIVPDIIAKEDLLVVLDFSIVG